MITEETGPRLLADMMKERPSDFNFDDIPDYTGPTGKASEGTSATLEQILGEFTFVGKDPVTLMEFYARKPKVNRLSAIMRLSNTPIEGIAEMSDIEQLDAVLNRLKSVAVMLLYVAAGEAWRPATAEEIGEAFDIGQLKSMNERFSGLVTSGEGSEGNA